METDAATGEAAGPEPIRVFLLDDHEVVRRGVRDLLETHDDITVVGEAGSAEEARNRIAIARPDVAVLDVQLEDGTGIEVCRDVRSEHPEIRCLMLTSFADDQALLDSVRKVAAGHSLLDAGAVQRMVDRLGAGTSSGGGDPRVANLSPQERRILDLLAEGLTNREIGERMFLAEKTVKNYVSNLLMKLGMKRRTEAAVFVARNLEDEAGR